MVFAKDQIEEIIAGENPDFRIRKNYQQEFFGIEITELYYSESNARLDNIKGYLGEILDGKRFRHRKDIKDLAAQQLTLQSVGKPDKQVEGIVLPFPSISDYVKMVVDIINKKSARIKDYVNGLTHVNLIIHDTGHRLIGIKRSDFYPTFFEPSFKAALRNSEFSEIYFITALEKNADRWIYIPLKMLLFVSQLYIFDGVLQHFYPQLNIGTPKEELLLFASYLCHIGISGIYVSDMPDKFEVICGKYGVILNDDKEVVIRDYSDYPLSHAIPFTNKLTEAFIDDVFENNVNEFIQGNTFVSGFFFDVNNLV